MTTIATECMLQLCEERHQLEDYQGGVPRWCTGCGDNANQPLTPRIADREWTYPGAHK